MPGNRKHRSATPTKRRFNKKVSRKIRKIEHEGIRGKKVSHEQAVGAAFGIVREQEKKHRKKEGTVQHRRKKKK